MIPLLTPQTLNVEKQNDSFYHNYLLPQLTGTLAPLHPAQRTGKGLLLTHDDLVDKGTTSCRKLVHRKV